MKCCKKLRSLTNYLNGKVVFQQPINSHVVTISYIICIREVKSLDINQNVAGGSFLMLCGISCFVAVWDIKIIQSQDVYSHEEMPFKFLTKSTRVSPIPPFGMHLSKFHHESYQIMEWLCPLWTLWRQSISS